MGAGQSAHGVSSQQTAQEIKTSYYDLLALPKDATDEDIKKAYRRKALELHPDRNYGDTERTTKLFAEVQSAYEVLSDKQERAWYDSHEDAILRDTDGGGAAGTDGSSKGQYERNVGLTTADDITRMFRKFHGNVEYSDAPSGFFGFLRDTFGKLAREEESAVQKDGGDLRDYPSFGHKDDNYEDVVKPFYAAWAGFSTTKSFAWRDRYKISDAEDRRMRRLMEKENKKFRGESIQEFNEAVRSLVAFVRKRDPRYKPNTQSEAERQQVLRDIAKAQATRMRAANLAQTSQEVPEWAKLREPDEVVEELEEESDEEHFECVACKKTFKSENQFEAHEKSKKHIKTVQALRRKLQKEGQSFDLDEAHENVHEKKLTEETAAEISSGGEDKTQGPYESEAPQGELDDCNLTSEKFAADDLDAITAELSLEGGPDQSVPASNESDSGSEADARGESLDSDQKFQTSDSDSTKQNFESTPKLGKAAQKRAKKSAKQNNSNQGDAKTKCAQCNAAFPSRTRLHQHVKDFGHAAPLQTTSNATKGKRR